MYQPITVDIYCRVSTDPQEDNTSLDEQEAAGRAYCDDNGLYVGDGASRGVFRLPIQGARTTIFNA